MASTHKSLLQMIIDIDNHPFEENNLTYWIWQDRNNKTLCLAEAFNKEASENDPTGVPDLRDVLGNLEIDQIEWIAREIVNSFDFTYISKNFKHKLYNKMYLDPIRLRLEELSQC